MSVTDGVCFLPKQDDLIRQIRALERVPRPKVKVFDPTESSKLGLLGEMSYAELQERLEVLRARDNELEEERRLTIVSDKRRKEEEMKARVENIVRIRAAKAEATKAMAAKRREDEEAKKVEDQRRRDEGACVVSLP